MKKKLFFVLAIFSFALSSTAQKPFKEIGKDNEVEVLTLSNGRYVEYFTNDTLRRIGSVMFNTVTNKVEYFIPPDDVALRTELERAKEVSRFMSVDPLNSKYPSMSPYCAFINNPINVVDPDGREGVVISGQPADHTNREHFLVNGLDRAKSLSTKFKKDGKGEIVTWFIYNGGGDAGYEETTLAKYRALAGKSGIAVQVVSNSEDIVKYVNEKNGDDSRTKDPISSFYYLGHATPGDLDVGYVNHHWWNELTNDKIEPSDFNAGAFKSGCTIDVVGGCRTAVDGDTFFEKSVIDQFAEKVDSKSTIKGSDVRVYYPGGVVSDKDLVKPNGGHVVEKKGTSEPRIGE